MIEWLKQLQAEEHGPLPTNMDLIISHGGLDLISKSLDLLLSPGDVVLVESPTYPSTLQLLRALQVQILGTHYRASYEFKFIFVQRFQWMKMVWSLNAWKRF